MEGWNNALLTARLDESFGQGRAGKVGDFMVSSIYKIRKILYHSHTNYRLIGIT